MRSPDAALAGAPAAWARSIDATETVEIGPSPRVDSFEAFERVFRDDEGLAWWVSAIGWLVITGCAGIAVYVVASAGLPWRQRPSVAPFVYALWAIVGLPGAIGWVWYTVSTVREIRGRPGELRAAYDRWRHCGVLTRSVPTGRSYRPALDENPLSINILIRPGTDARAAGRLRASVRDWFRDVDVDAAEALFQGRHVIPAEDIFGGDACGGFVTNRPTRNNWILLLPPVRSGAEWTRFQMSADTARDLQPE
ncbi:hypothetical protein [Mycolicibacterium sp. HK-90]|uniref:hypothetical protein n=1 Tax=Mycolicibacterium sp. HK-90 TaxID=3056937 RepID=UPI00265A7C6E|nr:hypothetical protein [Mycolicibacterium sp. HK-90]WKG03372.1 hypothetical protein QU592_30065 [Mycolicibacterium sp. HK-90]